MEKIFTHEQVGDTDIKNWKINDREFCNMILLDCIKLHYVLYGPNLRFIQMLWSYGIVDEEDRFYEEPYDTIKRILPKLRVKLNDSKIEFKLSAQILKNNIIRNLKNINIDVSNNN